MKTLYEILQVSEHASNEIIEKAYKVLAKKYHPDLQPQEQKEKAEKLMKQINEAYAILSNTQKRKEYDEKLKIERQKQEEVPEYNNVSPKNEYSNFTEEQEQYKKQQEYSKKIQEDLQRQYEQKYQDAYEGYLRSLGYKIKYKWTWKNYRDFLITIIILIMIGAILWFLPPTHKLILDFYESNNIIKTIIDIIGNIFVGIWNAICSIFK